MTVEEFQEEVANLLCASAMWTAEDRAIAADMIMAMRGDESAMSYGQISLIIALQRRYFKKMAPEPAAPRL